MYAEQMFQTSKIVYMYKNKPVETKIGEEIWEMQGQMWYCMCLKTVY